MDEINNNNIYHDKLRSTISETKVVASDNLKYRIMQQIQTEKALSRSTNSTSSVKTLLSTFGVMYFLIAIVLIGIYFTFGTINFESQTLIVTIISIASVCSMFGLISAFDEKRRQKHK